MYFVAGITGNTGGAAARTLLAEGKAVRSLVRDPAKAAAWAEQGVEVRQGDWTNAEAMAKALEGVEGAYLMLPPGFTYQPGFPEAKVVIDSYVEALRRTPVPRLIVLSSFGSQQTSGLGLITPTHLLEVALADLPFPTAFIRAGSFIENALFTIKTAAGTGVYYSMLAPTNKPIPYVATADIGKEVARLLVAGWSGKKFIELGTLRSPDDIASALAQVLSRPVKAQAMPRDQWTSTLEATGFPKGQTGLYEEAMDGVNSGWIDFGVPGCDSVASTTTPVEVLQAAKAKMGF